MIRKVLWYNALGCFTEPPIILKTYTRYETGVRMRKYRRQRKRDAPDVGFVEHRKKRKYFPGRYGSQKSREAYARWIAEHITSQPDIVRSVQSVAGLVLAYLRFARGYYRPGRDSEFHHLRRALDRVAGLYGSLPASQFGPVALETIQRCFVADGHARTYVNQQINRIRRCFRWGVRKQLIKPDVLVGLTAVDGLKRGRTEARECDKIKPVPWEDVQPVFEFVSPVVAAMIQAQWFIGVRPSNVCNLRPAELDRTEDVWVFRALQHKNDFRGQLLVVPVGPKAQAVLAPFLDRPDDAFCFSPRESAQWQSQQRAAARKTPHTPSSKANKRSEFRHLRESYTRNGYHQAINYGIAKVNRFRQQRGQEPLAEWNPGQLRHGRGTEIAHQYGIEAARVTLGHATLDATQIYAERDFQLAARIANETG